MPPPLTTTNGDPSDNTDLTEALLLISRMSAHLALGPLWLAEPDLTFREFHLLTLLAERGCADRGALSTALEITESVVNRLCQRLVGRNLVQYAPSPGDQRTVCVELTEPGRAFVEHTLQAQRAEVLSTITRVPAQDRPALARALRQLAS